MTHLEAWQDLWGLYCECFRESFGQHDIVLSPIVLEEFAIRIEKAAREDERSKLSRPEVAADLDHVDALKWRKHVQLLRAKNHPYIVEELIKAVVQHVEADCGPQPPEGR